MKIIREYKTVGNRRLVALCLCMQGMEAVMRQLLIQELEAWNA